MATSQGKSANYEPKLGQLITDGSGLRDAVHIAIAPVIAGHCLSPGQHVGFLDDGRVGAVDKPIGIIDPFLTFAVVSNQECWLLLYPGSITGMRHQWSHPAFVQKSRLTTTRMPPSQKDSHV